MRKILFVCMCVNALRILWSARAVFKCKCLCVRVWHTVILLCAYVCGGAMHDKYECTRVSHVRNNKTNSTQHTNQHTKIETSHQRPYAGIREILHFFFVCLLVGIPPRHPSVIMNTTLAHVRAYVRVFCSSVEPRRCRLSTRRRVWRVS